MLNLWKDILEQDFDSTLSQYGIMDINKNIHSCYDQKKLSAREQTMQLVEEKYTKKKEDITRPLVCTNTRNICDGIFNFCNLSRRQECCFDSIGAHVSSNCYKYQAGAHVSSNCCY